jgi:O-antigen/teichoic acid export membrane protein
MSISFLNKTIQRPIFRNLSLGLFSQIVISIANFLNGLCIARMASKEEYGAYSTAMTIILIFMNFQQALIHSPVLVQYHHKNENDRLFFLQSVNIGQWFLFIPIIIVGLAVTMVCDHFFRISSTYYLLFILLPVMYIREYQRTIDYCRLSIGTLFISDGVFSLSVIAGSFVLFFTQIANSFNGILVLTCAYICACLSRYRLIKQMFVAPGVSVFAGLNETWKLGKWALASVASGNIQNYGYVFIVNGMLSIKSVAELSAARLFIMPFNILLTGISKIYLSKGTQILASSGKRKVLRFNNTFLIPIIIAWLFFFFFLLFFRGFVIEHLFTSKYANISNTILIWAFYILTESISKIYQNTILVFQKYKSLAKISFVSAMIVTIGCFILIKITGENGAIISLLIGSVFSLAYVMIRFRLIYANWKFQVRE